MYILFIFYSAFLPVTGFHLYCVGCPSTGIFPSQSGMDSCLCTFRHRLRRGGMIIRVKSFSRRAVQTNAAAQAKVFIFTVQDSKLSFINYHSVYSMEAFYDD